jgi:hypothetical protein
MVLAAILHVIGIDRQVRIARLSRRAEGAEIPLEPILGGRILAGPRDASDPVASSCNEVRRRECARFLVVDENGSG